MIKITSCDDNRIAVFRNMKHSQLQHLQSNVFVVEGRRMTEKLLQNDIKVLQIFAESRYYTELEVEKYADKLTTAQLFYADRDIMTEIVGYRLHSGIMALAEQPQQLSSVHFPAIALNFVEKAENVGAIIRNCAAFGIRSAISDGRSAHPYHRRSVRSSMGGIFACSIFPISDMAATVCAMKVKGVNIVAVENVANGMHYRQWSYTENSLYIFGNESMGISPDLLDIADFILTIPISTSIESLNVATASGIILSQLAFARH